MVLFKKVRRVNLKGGDMKIHLISDLHIDFKEYIHKFPECDLVVIAGDLGENPYYLAELCKNNPDSKIIYVPGNHDFYGASFESQMMTFSSIQKDHKNLTVLQNHYIEVNDILIFGSTLWSGLNAYGDDLKTKLRQWYEYNISDCRYITGWSSHLMLEEHRFSKSKLAEFLEQYKDKKKIVVTHFAPSLHSVHENYSGSVPFNSYWCNNFSDNFITQADLWCHGHVHNNFDYTIRAYDSEKSCRVVCNPRGYITEYGEENLNFDPNLILEI